MSMSPILKKMWCEWIANEGSTKVFLSLETKIRASNEPGFRESPISKDRIFGLPIVIDNKMKPGEFRFE